MLGLKKYARPMQNGALPIFILSFTKRAGQRSRLKMKTSFYWHRRVTCGDETHRDTRHINAVVTATTSGFEVDLCEQWLPEDTQGMEPDELAEIRIRAIMEAFGQRWAAKSFYFDWEVEAEPCPPHTDPDGETIAAVLVDMRADAEIW